MTDQKHIFIISELAQTHEGQVPLAKQLIEITAQSGADAVKCHMFTADELAVPAYAHYDLLKKLQWPKETWKELVTFAHQQGIKFYADVLGSESLPLALECQVDGIKVHATDLSNEPFLRELSKVQVPLLLSCGGADLKELTRALDILSSGQAADHPVVLLYGFQSYPTKIEDTHLQKMKYFGQALKVPYGYADHIDGDDAQKFALCAMAVGMGASVLEKHLTIDRKLKMEDYESSLGPEDFKEFVRLVRQWEQALGCMDDAMGPAEAQYRQSIRRQVVAVKPIAAGQVINACDVALKRAPAAHEPASLGSVVGQLAKCPFQVHDVIQLSELQHARSKL